MEYVIFFGAILAFYLLVVIQGTINEKKMKNYFMARLKKESCGLQ